MRALPGICRIAIAVIGECSDCAASVSSCLLPAVGIVRGLFLDCFTPCWVRQCPDKVMLGIIIKMDLVSQGICCFDKPE